MLQGFLPDTPAVDSAVGLRTADKVAELWTDDKIFGWGRPVLALNSARVGNPERAVRYLTAYDYWVFDDAGFAQRGGNGTLPERLLRDAGEIKFTTDMNRWHTSPFPAGKCWVPLRWQVFRFSTLAAEIANECVVAYMAAGWQGSEGHAPGFPQDGSWIVKHEGLHKAL